MKPFYEREGIKIYVGDNREVLPHIEPVASVVTDPPSGISFMGKEWDSNKGGRDQWIAWLAETLRGVSDAMLPGAHALVWALPRTSGWTSMAIEDAGLDVRDCITHLFGTGFPKSADVSKHIDKMAGAEREVTGTRDVGPDMRGDNFHRDRGDRMIANITAPATPEAEQWQGWGTALKPAAEFWYLARKPFKGTVAQNVLQHGTGAINVDACRIGTTDELGRTNNVGPYSSDRTWSTSQTPGQESHGHDSGRWPSNVILDEEAAMLLDAQSGERKSGGGRVRKAQTSVSDSGWVSSSRTEAWREPSTGGASRFFKVVAQDAPTRFLYQSKASRRDRSANGTVANIHPTCKPTTLMKYLIQMITPPGGVILDPFMGSGSTLVAAAELGFHAIGIELGEEYAEIAARRVDHTLNERAKRLPGLEATP